MSTYGRQESPGSCLMDFYREHVNGVLLPFWMDLALDKRHGGVFTCFENAGDSLRSTDKYTWSQGRFVWVLSRLASLCDRRIMPGDASWHLEHASKTVGFLRENAFLENGNCAFLLTESGEKIESQPGEGFDTSFYADCFVVLGFSEFARIARDSETLEIAVQLYDRIRRRLSTGGAPSEPYPVNENFKAHSVSMIMLNVSQELRNTLRSISHPRTEELHSLSREYMVEIMETFVDQQRGILREMLPRTKGGSCEDTVLARHVNPGHTVECMWFVIDEALAQGCEKYVESATHFIEKAIEVGWDEEYGGLLRFIDRDGGPPRGRRLGDRYERLVLETWDTKLWWPHAEALYATLRAREVTGEGRFEQLYEYIHDYVFRTFPDPDSNFGEWVQIRDRRGGPVDKLVALPVKDPYHTLRGALLTIELLHRGTRPE